MPRSIEALKRERRMRWGARIFQLHDESKLDIIEATGLFYHVQHNGHEAVFFMDTGLVVYRGCPMGWGLRDLKRVIGVR